MELLPEKKIAGVLAPLFGLRGDNDLGIGDLATLRELIDWAAAAGFRLVQMLPINETGGDNSPYNAISAMAIEPTTLHLAPGSPEDLTAEDYKAVIDQADIETLRHGPVKYQLVKRLKRNLLGKAFEKFAAAAPQDRRFGFADFCKTESAWLDDYAFFRALMEANGDCESWDTWPDEQRQIKSAQAWLARQPAEIRLHFSERENFFRYVQWIARQQWFGTKAYADNRDVALMGDIPFGISYYSADVFCRPDEFSRDWCGGAPPEAYFKDDAFTQKWGQNWGIPLYRWQVMREREFDWWRQRIRSVRHSFHLFRIDHILGFYRIYAFPWRPQQNKKFLSLEWREMLERTNGRAPHFAPRDDSSPENCEANRKEGEEYLRIVLEECNGSLVIGEDLGTVPDYVRPSLHSLGIAGFKIPHWEFYHGRVTPGSEYEPLSVATYSTHDHKPIRSLWDEALFEPTETSDQARFELEKIATFAEFKRTGGAMDFEGDFYPAMMEALFKSNSWIAIVMITDLLARKYRFNVPGVSASSNWTRRMQRSVSQLSSSRKERSRTKLIRKLLEKTGRA